jgi:hypothetical protein
MVVSLYTGHSSSSIENPNTYLTNVNYAVQICFNIIYLILAIAILGIAYFQLNKTAKATTIQTLIELDSYIRSDGFLVKRRKIGEIISVNGLENLKVWIEKFNTKDGLKNEENSEIENLAFVKNVFESVIYEFELIGHFYKSHVFTIDDVYQLFSIEVQNYWILMSEIGYIKYLRENESEDFYDKFENLFNDTLKQEIINDSSNLLIKEILKFYYWTGTYKIFYKKQCYLWLKTNNKMAILSESIKKKIPLFIKEEKNLI